ncbi:ketoacyl-synt-domain-containing protein [Durotheca rogersii]|uniref:ketoacyl-synt-domain-containing protein n=1 Tax=Durotheca rogersii TaxID=419775 RepID=UPI00221F44BA|nr:ketoacyl-synt-domain-containing protein [Durotheca rogersii]KAI5860199.1 ketoacyl-synt-domain-containing protein [Durotheca rogersii]
MEPGAPLPIAIVGMSCRLPGDVSSPGDFWKLLAKGRSAWSKIPRQRSHQEVYNHPGLEKEGNIYSQGGYFLSEDLELFDPGFFDMTRKEAETMDPTQRLLLECSYEALENAGIPKESISGQKVGVFIGGPDNEHGIGNLRDLDNSPMFDPTGNRGGFLAGRISHFFDLRGPSLTAGAACSSSMHAIHMAVQSIRLGESEQAIVGASHIITQPDVWVSMARLRLFADSGRTHAFENRAKSGYARGEGVGCLILKPVDRAVENNDNIRAVISHTGINHNGRTVGVVTPGSEAQEPLLCNVLIQAGIDARDIGFFEEYGTGTKAGDPIEARGIRRALGQNLEGDEPLRVGSVKSNVGHLENASGIISVMKAALMLEKGVLVSNADFERENLEIPFSEWNLKIPQRQEPFPRSKKYICVKNFGCSGSNGHAVLSRLPAGNETEHLDAERLEDHVKTKRIFILSANDEAAARKSMEQLGIFPGQHAELYESTLPRNLAYTLCQRRSKLPWRVAVVADTCSKLAVALSRPEAMPKRAPTKSPKLAFVFTGQGAQWNTVGRELLKSYAVFASSIQRADNHLRTLGADFSLLEELLRDEQDSRVDMAHISQPICSAVQIGLVDLLASWGVKPSAVAGHSTGEISAAYTTGTLTLETAMSVAYFRGQAIVAFKQNFQTLEGSMMVVGTGAEELQPFLKQLRNPLRVAVAYKNSPTSTTVSGDTEAVDELSVTLASNKIISRKLFVDVAYHSPHMKLIAETYYSMIADITLRDADDSVDFFSSLSSHRVDAEELGPRYWVDNLTSPVLFATGLRALCKRSEPDILIEIGPHSALKGLIMEIPKMLDLPVAKTPAYMPTLIRNHDVTETTLELVGQLFVRGYEGIDFFNVNHNRSEAETPDVVSFLYTYPWSRRCCWYRNRITQQHRLSPFARHDLIGTLTGWGYGLEPTWRNFIRLEKLPWLRDYRVQTRSVFPVSAFVSMVIEAASQRAALGGVGAGRFHLRNIIVPEHLFLEKDRPVETVLKIRARHGPGMDWGEFIISSFESTRGWLEHCHGFVEAEPTKGDYTCPSNHRTPLDPEFAGNESFMPAAVFYFNLSASGMSYPHSFCNLVRITKADEYVVTARGVFLDTKPIMPLAYESSYVVHPATLEPLVQVSQGDLGFDGIVGPQLPCAIKHIDINASKGWEQTFGTEFIVQSIKDARSNLFSAELFTPVDSELPFASIFGLELAPINTTPMLDSKPRELCYNVRWEQADERRVNDVSCAHIKANGERITVVTERACDDTLVTALCKVIRLRSGVTPNTSSLHQIGDFDGFFVVLSELDRAVLGSINKAEFERVQSLLARTGGVLWVTCGASKVPMNPSTNMAQGLFRSLRSELGKTAVTLDLDPDSTLGTEGQAKLIEDAFRRTVLSNSAEADREFAEQEGRLVVPRYVVDDDMNLRVNRELGRSEPYSQELRQSGRRLRVAPQAGIFRDMLSFEDVPTTEILGDDQVEVEIKASRLGSDDVLALAGTNRTIRPERSCSGNVVRVGCGITDVNVGDRVCALTVGQLGTHIYVTENSVVKMPETVSFEDAAMIPSAFGTAFYALVQVARIQKSDRLLVQVNSAEGLAAIQIAQHVGAEVFAATHGSKSRDFVFESFGICPEHVFDAGSIYFDHEVQRALGGDIEEIIGRVWTNVAPFGRVVHLYGGFDNRLDDRSDLAENICLTSINMRSLTRTHPQLMKEILIKVTQCFSKGLLKPLRRSVALRMAELGRGLEIVQRGALHPVVVSVQQGDVVMASHDTSKRFLNPNGTHIIIGGTGNIGRCTAKWMVEHGAKHIVLLSRSGGDVTRVKQLMDATRDRASIVVKACDIAEGESVHRVVRECAEKHLPVCGVVHAAVMLHDDTIGNMTHESYISTIRAKVQGTWNIHNALESNNAHPDYFVLLSSVVGIVGSRGRAAYAAASTFLDGFARYRVAQGLPGVSLDLTVVMGADYTAAETARRKESIDRNFGGQFISDTEVLGLLAVAMSGKCGPQYLTGLKLVPSAAGALPYYAQDPRFAHLEAAAAAVAEIPAASGDSGPAVSYRNAFRAAAGSEEARLVVVRSVEHGISGLDSLTSIEVRNWITRGFGATLESLEVLTSANVANLAESIVSRAEA